METNRKIRVMIVEDHPMYRVGLRMSLSYFGSEMEVVAEAEDVHRAVEFLQDHGKEIDLIMLDFFLPDGNGMDVANVAKTVSPETKVLLITGDALNPTILHTVEGQVDGVIGKTVKPEELKMCIESMFKGGGLNKNVGGSESLSSRELEIVRLCAEGKTAQEIAETLNISKRTVEAHKVRIFNKLNCKSTAELVNYAFRNGLVN